MLVGVEAALAALGVAAASPQRRPRPRLRAAVCVVCGRGAGAPPAGAREPSSPSRRGGQAAAVLHRRNPCGWLAASSGQAVAPCRWGAGPHGAVEAGRAVNEARPVPESLVVVGNQRAWRRMGRRAQRRHPAAVGGRSRAGGRQARSRSDLARVASAAACHSAPGFEGRAVVRRPGRWRGRPRRRPARCPVRAGGGGSRSESRSPLAALERQPLRREELLTQAAKGRSGSGSRLRPAAVGSPQLFETRLRACPRAAKPASGPSTSGDGSNVRRFSDLRRNRNGPVTRPMDRPRHRTQLRQGSLV